MISVSIGTHLVRNDRLFGAAYITRLVGGADPVRKPRTCKYTDVPPPWLDELTKQSFYSFVVVNNFLTI